MTALRQVRVLIPPSDLAALGPRPATALKALVLAVLARSRVECTLVVAEQLPDRDHQLLLRIRASDQRAQVELLQRWDRTLRRLCRQYAGRDVQPEDLHAAAQLGLLEAASRWRLGQGWVGYAVSWVRKALQRQVRHSGVVSLSEHDLRQGRQRPKGWGGLERL